MEEHGRVHHLGCRAVQRSSLWQATLFHVEAVLVRCNRARLVRKQAFDISLSPGIRSKPHSCPMKEKCSSIRTTAVSIQLIVQMKSKTICCRGCSKTLPRTRPWSPYNKHRLSLALLVNENNSTNGQCSHSPPSPPLIALNTKCRIISPIPLLSLFQFLVAHDFFLAIACLLLISGTRRLPSRRFSLSLLSTIILVYLWYE